MAGKLVSAVAQLHLQTLEWLQARATAGLLTTADDACVEALRAIDELDDFDPCPACPECLEWSTDPSAAWMADAALDLFDIAPTFETYCGPWATSWMGWTRNLAANITAADEYNGNGSGAGLAEQWTGQAENVQNALNIAENVVGSGLTDPKGMPDWAKWILGIIAAREVLNLWSKIR